MSAPEGARRRGRARHLRPGARDEALAAGADAFLRKPVDPLELVSTVKDLLGAGAPLDRRVQERASGRAPTSGDEGLDLILGGGLPRNGINLIMGLPGSGKTLLCQQFMFAGATAERPAIYLSTVSEPFEKIVRYAQTLSFFDHHAIGRSVFYEDLGSVVAGEGGLDRRHRARRRADQGAPAGDHRDRQLQGAGRVRRRRARIPALPARPRRAAHGLPRHLLLDRRIQRGRGADGAGVRRRRRDHLAGDRARERARAATDQVAKLRGSDFRSGRHTYRLSEDGITVFPRLADPARQDDYRLSDVRISSGIPSLDTMLADGYGPGSSTLVAGPSGAGRR